MTGEKEMLKLVESGGKIRRDFAISLMGFFKVINGTKVKMFPMTLLRNLEARKIIEFKALEGCCSYYGLVPKERRLLEK